KNITTVFKLYPFSTVDPSLKTQYQQHISQHHIAQSTYQNPNQSNRPQYAGKMYSLGWQKRYEIYFKIGTTAILRVSSPLFNKVKQKQNYLNVSGLEPNFKEDTNGFTCHLSFTIFNFAKITKTMMAHPSNFSCGSQSNISQVTWLNINLK
ncbi:hypothetical protein VP01_4017g1, partial [Puccinia sorghi]